MFYYLSKTITVSSELSSYITDTRHQPVCPLAMNDVWIPWILRTGGSPQALPPQEVDDVWMKIQWQRQQKLLVLRCLGLPQTETVWAFLLDQKCFFMGIVYPFKLPVGGAGGEAPWVYWTSTVRCCHTISTLDSTPCCLATLMGGPGV